MMALSQLQVTELEAMARTADPGYLRTRALAVLSVLADGRSRVETAGIFRITRQTVATWVKHYLADGVEGLRIAPGRGRKQRADLGEVRQVALQSPRSLGYQRSRWTLALLAEAVSSLHGFTPAGVKQALRRAGLSFKRGQVQMFSPDPDYEVKKGR